jgi:hypothetical protein
MKKINYLLFLSAATLFILYGCSSTSEVIIHSRTEWKADNPKPYKIHVPAKITIHHEGEVFEKGQNAPEHIKAIQTWGMSQARNWTDIPYHFLIDPDGVIFEGRNVFTAGETATEYDPSGHLLITCMGNFEVQQISEAQLNSLINLIAYCCEKYQISAETIAAHKDYAETLCPGKDLYKYLENNYIQDRVKDLLK